MAEGVTGVLEVEAEDAEVERVGEHLREVEPAALVCLHDLVVRAREQVGHGLEERADRSGVDAAPHEVFADRPHALDEGGDVLRWPVPEDVRQRREARPGAPLGAPAVGDELRPEVALAAEDVPAAVFGDAVAGVEARDLGDVDEDAEGLVFLGVVLKPLHVIEVAEGVGAHDDVESLLRRGDAVLGAAVALDDDAPRQVVPGRELVPAHQPAAFLLEVGGESLRRPALEVVDVLDPQLADARLAVGALLPAPAAALVAADVDHLAREELDHLVQDVPVHLERRLLAEAELARVAAAGAAELGVGGDRGAGVAGDVDLRDDADAALGGVADDVADLVLGVEEGAVFAACAVEPHRRPAVRVRLARGAGLGQLRIAVDLEPPAVAVGEVPVEDVELVLVHEVERLLDVVDVEEVAAYVQHVAAPGEARRFRRGGQLAGQDCRRQRQDAVSARASCRRGLHRGAFHIP